MKCKDLKAVMTEEQWDDCEFTEDDYFKEVVSIEALCNINEEAWIHVDLED